MIESEAKRVQSMPYLEINQGDDPPQNQRARQQTRDMALTSNISPDGVVLSSLDRERLVGKESIGEGEREGLMGDATSSPSIPSFYTPNFLRRR